MQRIWMFILIGIVIILVGVSAFLYGQNQGIGKNGAATTENTNSSLVASPTVPVVSPVITQGSEVNVPVVVIEAEGAFPPEDVTQIKSRVIQPYIDFKNDTQPGEVVSIQVSQNPHASKNEFPYLFDAIYKNGGNEGFVIGKTNGLINWYIPECLNGCQFSESFTAKYPEIVKLAQ